MLGGELALLVEAKQKHYGKNFAIQITGDVRINSANKSLQICQDVVTNA